MYEGEKRSSEELSVIHVSTFASPFSPYRWGGYLHILGIDEIDLSMFPCCYYEVLPGTHTIYGGLYQGFIGFGGYTNRYRITFDTEAGKKYSVDFRSKYKTYFIFEDESGKVIYDQAGLSN